MAYHQAGRQCVPNAYQLQHVGLSSPDEMPRAGGFNSLFNTIPNRHKRGGLIVECWDCQMHFGLILLVTARPRRLENNEDHPGRKHENQKIRVGVDRADKGVMP